MIGGRSAIVILPFVRFNLFNDGFDACFRKAENVFLHSSRGDVCTDGKLVVHIGAGNMRIGNGIKPFPDQLYVTAYSCAANGIKCRKCSFGISRTDICRNETCDRRPIGGVVAVVCPRIIPSPDYLWLLRRVGAFTQRDRMQPCPVFP